MYILTASNVVLVIVKNDLLLFLVNNTEHKELGKYWSK